MWTTQVTALHFPRLMLVLPYALVSRLCDGFGQPQKLWSCTDEAALAAMTEFYGFPAHCPIMHP